MASFAHPTVLARMLFLPLCVTLFCQCTTSASATAKLYMARGQTSLAWEYWRLAVADSPGSDRIRADALVAHALQSHELGQEIDELKEAKRPIRALGFVVTLEEAAAAGQQLKLGSDDPAAFVTQRRALAQAAADALQQDLDARLARGLPELHDLMTCDTLKGLASTDDVARMCDRLLNNFKHVAVLKAAPGSYGTTAAVMARAAQAITQQHVELLEVSNQPDAQNAALEIYMGAPITRSSGWVLTKRDAFHKAVPRLDAAGNPVVEHIVIEPTAAEIADAAKHKRRAPAPHTENRMIYDQVAGEYRYYTNSRRVTVPYRAALTDLRSNTVVALVTDKLELDSTSNYHTYAGDPRARQSPEPSGPMRREDAPALLTEAQLLDRASQTIPTDLTKAIAADLE